MSAGNLFATLKTAGFRVSLWRDQRIYLQGHGRDIRAYLEPLPDATSADGAYIAVESNWRSPQNALRCKSVRHAIMLDLYDAGFLTSPPPEDWRNLPPMERPPRRQKMERIRDDDDSFAWPESWPRSS